MEMDPLELNIYFLNSLFLQMNGGQYTYSDIYPTINWDITEGHLGRGISRQVPMGKMFLEDAAERLTSQWALGILLFIVITH